MSAWSPSHLSEAKILVVRNDGLGDFVLTLPLVAALKQQLPGARIYALVNQHLQGLLPLLPDLEGMIVDEGVLLKRHRNLYAPRERKERRRDLLEQIKAQRFDLALLPYSEAASAALIHRARIPWRAGSGRRIYGWRFNLRNTASRKGSQSAEYELNLTYLARLGLEQTFTAPGVKLPTPQAGGEFDSGGRDYVVIHPHKRSSTALSWPIGNFVELARKFLRAGLDVTVVGDEPDAPVLREHFGQLRELRVATGLSLPELVGLIARARLFVGNSSGPLHVAGLTGTPHIGFYPQNRVSSPARWRTLPVPDGPGASHRYLLESSFPKNCVTCEMEKCTYFNCVASISMERVDGALRAWGLDLNGESGKGDLQATGS
ncbi:MAG: glycosyltransferase family 9 protein [SAR324 cluster bacterium]|nr:glycosyltransferase family 9 protein [SAR324 cluster bacterium]